MGENSSLYVYMTVVHSCWQKPETDDCSLRGGGGGRKGEERERERELKKKMFRIMFIANINWQPRVAVLTVVCADR